jgi:hypothetical protein
VFELTQGYRSGTKIPGLFISAFQFRSPRRKPVACSTN